MFIYTNCLRSWLWAAQTKARLYLLSSSFKYLYTVTRPLWPPSGRVGPALPASPHRRGSPVPSALRRPCLGFSRVHPYLSGSGGPDPDTEPRSQPHRRASPAPLKASARGPSAPPPPVLDASAPLATAAALPPAAPPALLAHAHIIPRAARSRSASPLTARFRASPHGSLRAGAEGRASGLFRLQVSPPSAAHALSGGAGVPGARPLPAAPRRRRAVPEGAGGAFRWQRPVPVSGGWRRRRRPVPTASGAPGLARPGPPRGERSAALSPAGARPPLPGAAEAAAAPPPRAGPLPPPPPSPQPGRGAAMPSDFISLLSADLDLESPKSLYSKGERGRGGGGGTTGRGELRGRPPRGCSAPGPLGPPAPAAFLARPRPPQECVPTGSARGGGGGLAARPGMRMGLAGPAAGNGAARRLNPGERSGAGRAGGRRGRGERRHPMGPRGARRDKGSGRRSGHLKAVTSLRWVKSSEGRRCGAARLGR